MKKVFCVNKGPYDYGAAETFGELVFCTEGTVDKYDIAQMFRELDKALEQSSPDDYLLITSLTSLCSVACAIFAERHHRLNLLIFRNGGYSSRSIIINSQGTQNDKAHRTDADS